VKPEIYRGQRLVNLRKSQGEHRDKYMPMYDDEITPFGVDDLRVRLTCFIFTLY